MGDADALRSDLRAEDRAEVNRLRGQLFRDRVKVLYLQKRGSPAEVQRVLVNTNMSGEVIGATFFKHCKEAKRDASPAQLLISLFALCTTDKEGWAFVRPFPWSEFPPELWPKVLSCLTRRQGAAASCSCRNFRSIVTHDTFTWAPSGGEAEGVVTTPQPRVPRPRNGGHDGGGILYATPQELVDMEQHDPARLRERFKQALDSVCQTGRLRPSDLQLPIFTSPWMASISPLVGYWDGEFDADTPGAACILLPPTFCRHARLRRGDYSINKVPTPPPFFVVSKDKQRAWLLYSVH